MATEINTPKQKYDILERERHFLDQTRINVSNSFDKYLLTFSVGALSLSITFTNAILNSLEIKRKNLLAIGWYFLIADILLTLLSFIISGFAFERGIKTIENRIDFIFGDKRESLNNPFNSWLKAIQVLSIIFFLIGIIFLSTFYLINLE